MLAGILAGGLFDGLLGAEEDDLLALTCFGTETVLLAYKENTLLL